ncbi:MULTISPECIES: dihydrodipicolinate synthase family protein [unclassified Pantoea]|uniref:dihydrodipicolinate synthase family protein n=1 Tax=unclassified Pantoea TaxID=2630326 RepID=UPI001CD49961|nr:MULTISPECIES: dihydrodipicolinate synthase family protein [unclassified Pantoea]MCA1177778.1 dihydrodipicolinate synthase family protein [Pantoea sp. alder69]MCA1252905.1 dihydrodipicolinate synthase family protein [Pantoea sp. alder70]MCA1266458.1 dihydrodipicolinate synthase family protein [Pantoea sp. alder81]
MTFEGIYTPAITPYAADGSIDFAAFANVLESLIEARVHGIIIGGSTGEYYAQSAEERLSLVEHARKVIGNRLPLIVGTGAIRTEDAVAFATHARDHKADAILVTSPPYALPTELENAHHALTVDKAAQLPIMLYNYPGRMGISMGETYFREVSRSNNVVAIKESSGDFNNLHLLACQFPNIALSCGWDDQALEFFAWGARSWVCAGSNFIPREHVALYNACVVEKDFDKGRKIMAAMMPLMNFLDGGKFVQSIKYGSELAGLKAGPVRAPLQGLEEDEKAQLQAVIDGVKRNVAAVAVL